MKKLLTGLLAALVALTTLTFCLSASAEDGFDISRFENDSRYTISVDAEDDRFVYIEPVDLTPFFFDPMISSDYYCSYVPDIYLINGTPVFRIWCNFFADREYIFETSEITVNGRIYTVEDVTGFTDYFDNGDILDASVCIFGTNLCALIDDMRADGEAKIRLIGRNGEYEFELTETITAAIVGMYDDFLAAGGPTPVGNLFESEFSVEEAPVSGGRLSPSSLIGKLAGRAPAGFDKSLFGSGYSVYETGSTGNYTIDLESFESCFFDPGYSDTYFSTFAPDILVWNDNSANFRLWCMFYIGTPYNIDTFEFTFPDAVYTLENVSSELAEEENGESYEFLYAEIGDESCALIEALRATLDSRVTLTLRGEKGYYAFSMDRGMREAIVETYDLFISAGGDAYLEEADEPTLTIH